jgi:hypothetical protein
MVNCKVKQTSTVIEIIRVGTVTHTRLLTISMRVTGNNKELNHGSHSVCVQKRNLVVYLFTPDMYDNSCSKDVHAKHYIIA